MKISSKLRTIRSGAILFAAVAAMCFMSQSAQAQSCGYGGGFGGGGYGGHRGVGGVNISVGRGFGGVSSFYGGYNSFRPSYGHSVRRPYFHDTSHLDYHPGGFVRHGNHFDYLPGHYDVHRTGHWHR